MPADANDASAASAAAATPEGSSEDVLELELDSADEAESEDSESGDEPGDDEAERARARDGVRGDRGVGQGEREGAARSVDDNVTDVGASIAREERVHERSESHHV